MSTRQTWCLVRLLQYPLCLLLLLPLPILTQCRHLPAGPGLLSMSAGDFEEVYGSPEHAGGGGWRCRRM